MTGHDVTPTPRGRDAVSRETGTSRYWMKAVQAFAAGLCTLALLHDLARFAWEWVVLDALVVVLGIGLLIVDRPQRARRARLYEQLAAVQHDIWSHWMRHLLTNKTMPAGNGDVVIASEDVDRWWRLINTPYADLTERERASDREQVDRYWPLLRDAS